MIDFCGRDIQAKRAGGIVEWKPVMKEEEAYA